LVSELPLALTGWGWQVRGNLLAISKCPRGRKTLTKTPQPPTRHRVTWHGGSYVSTRILQGTWLPQYTAFPVVRCTTTRWWPFYAYSWGLYGNLIMLVDRSQPVKMDGRADAVNSATRALGTQTAMVKRKSTNQITNR